MGKEGKTIDRLDFYFRQLVGESDLDDAFDKVESSIRNIPGDLGLVGVASGLGVAEVTPTPNLTLNLSGPGVAYDSLGQRLFVAATQNVDMSTDENGTGTAVATGGNEKWLSIFLAFDRSLSDPRLDGNSATVFYQRDESFSINVAQGGEATIGTATRPPVRPNEILLADVRIENGQTQIENADIDTTRRQDLLTFQGVSVDIRGDNLQQAFNEFGQALDDHIAAGTAHTAVQITYAGGSAWNDGDTNPAGTVESTLDSIFTDLAGTAGSDKIGAVANAGSPIALSTGSVQDQLREVQSQANAQLNTNSADIATLQTDLNTAEATLLRIQQERAGRLWRTVDDLTSLIEPFNKFLHIWDPSSDHFLVFGVDDTPATNKLYGTRDGRAYFQETDNITPFFDTPITYAATDGAGTFLISGSTGSPYFNTTPGDYSAWTEITNNDDPNIGLIAYHNGLWILSRATDSTTIETTPTLSATPTWSTRALATVSVVTGDKWASNGTRIVICQDSVNAVDYSDDAILWNDGSAGLELVLDGVLSLIWWPGAPGGGAFVYIGGSAAESRLYRSADGNGWTIENAYATNYPFSGVPLALATDGVALYVYLSGGGGGLQTRDLILRTTDWTTWEVVQNVQGFVVAEQSPNGGPTPPCAIMIDEGTSGDSAYISQRIDD